MKKAAVPIVLLALVACAPTTLVLLGLVACTPTTRAVVPAQEAPPAKAPPEATILPVPPEKAERTAITLPTEPALEPTPEPEGGSLNYYNDKYGFSLRYPDGWALTEVPSDGRFSDSVKLSRETFTLIIGFKGAGEDLIIEAGMPAGDLEQRGTVTVLGSEVPRQVLVFEGKDKAVYYNGTTPVQAGELLMLIGLHDLVTSNYDAVAIPEDVQAEADLIVASLESS